MFCTFSDNSSEVNCFPLKSRGITYSLGLICLRIFSTSNFFMFSASFWEQASGIDSSGSSIISILEYFVIRFLYSSIRFERDCSLIFPKAYNFYIHNLLLLLRALKNSTL